MEKRLELLFENEEGRQVTISLPDPIEPVDPERVKTVMQTVIDRDVFTSSGGNLVAIRGARIVSHQVEVIDVR